MPRPLSQKPVKRATKKMLPASVPAPSVSGEKIEIKTMPMAKHHGLLVGNIILVFLVIGCLSAAFLMSEKMKASILVASDAAARLSLSEKGKEELQEELRNIKTLNSLASKVAATDAFSKTIEWETYTSPKLSLQYPRGYEVVKDDPYLTLVIKNNEARIEIFRYKDFPGDDRVLGFSGDEPAPSQTEIDDYIPKAYSDVPVLSADSKIEPYTVWVFYKTGDEGAKAILEQVVSSIKVLK